MDSWTAQSHKSLIPNQGSVFNPSTRPAENWVIIKTGKTKQCLCTPMSWMQVQDIFIHLPGPLTLISCHSSFVEFKFRLCIKNLIQFLHCVSSCILAVGQKARSMTWVYKNFNLLLTTSCSLCNEWFRTQPYISLISLSKLLAVRVSSSFS